MAHGLGLISGRTTAPETVLRFGNKCILRLRYNRISLSRSTPQSDCTISSMSFICSALVCCKKLPGVNKNGTSGDSSHGSS